MENWTNEQKISYHKKLSRKSSGKNNPRALKIKVFDEKDEEIFESNDNFKGLCKSFNLPQHHFVESYKNNGSKIHLDLTKSSKTILIKNGRYYPG